jgi:hypothetical protein
MILFSKGDVVVKKALLFVVAILSLAATPALAGPYIDIPAGLVNFDGNGQFDQSVPGVAFDAVGPLPPNPGVELFGVGTISGVAMMDNLGLPVWQPADVGPNYEMTYSFWDAVIVASGRVVRPDPVHAGHVYVDLWAVYTDEARLVLVSDTSKDFTGAAGPVAFDQVTGDFPTAYTLPAGGAAPDPDESLYLDLLLATNSSNVTWSSWSASLAPLDPVAGFTGGSFSSMAAEINGGYGQSHFIDWAGGPDGAADGFILTFNIPGPLIWAFGADTDIQLHAVPEPTAMISLFAGLALLAGYRFRKH